MGRQTLAQWQGYSGFLFDQGLLAGPDGKPLRPRPTTTRCSRTTSCRETEPGLGRWGPPLALVAFVLLLGGLCPPRRPRPDHAPAPSRVVGALWDSREVAAGHLVPTLVEALAGCAFRSCSRS